MIFQLDTLIRALTSLTNFAGQQVPQPSPLVKLAYLSLYELP
jgi:hypothetical protein